MKKIFLLFLLFSLTGCSLFGIEEEDTFNPGGGNSSKSTVQSVNDNDGTFKFNGSSVTALNTSISGDLVIPESFNGQSITTIPKDAFKNCIGIKSIVLPNTINSVAAGAFSGCLQLESITVPFCGLTPGETGVKGHFGQIFGTASYNGGTPVKSYYGTYDSNTYYYPSALRKVTITNATTLVYGAFQNASLLTEINLNNEILAVGNYCFSGANQIKSISLPGVYTIPNYCFENCTKLESFTIGDKVTKISNYAFDYCINLAKINSQKDGEFIIPSNVKEISDNVFRSCLKLESITLPFIGNSDSETGVKGHFGRIFSSGSYTGSISARCYYGTYDSNTYYIPSGLRSVVITEATHVVYGAFQNMSMLTSLRINSAAQSTIGKDAFTNCIQPVWY